MSCTTGPSQWSLADSCNTTVEDGQGTVFDDGDTQNRAYEANLRLLQANALSELDELQRQQRGSLAYNTSDCQIQPLFQKWDAERAAGCMVKENVRQQLDDIGSNLYMAPPTQIPGMTAETWRQNARSPYGPMYPIYGMAPPSLSGGPISSEVAELQNIPYDNSMEESSGVSMQGLGGQRFRAQMATVPKCMLNTVRGVAYDLKHLKKLPPMRAGKGMVDTAKFVITRDDRLQYILLILALLILIVAFIAACYKWATPNRSKGSPSPFYPVPYYVPMPLQSAGGPATQAMFQPTSGSSPALVHPAAWRPS